MQFLKNAVKIVISFGLLAYLIIDADPARILQTMKKVVEADGIVYALYALVLYLISIALMAVRWDVLLRGYHIKLPISTLFGYYIIGLFFNNFLPTSIGGDVVRIYKVIESTGDRTHGFSSVIIERILGIAATLFLAIVSLAFISEHVTSARVFYIIFTLFIFILGFMYILIRRRPFILLLKIFDKITIFHIGERINKLLESIHYFRARRRILLYVFILSLFSQIAIVFMNYFIVKSFSLKIDLFYLFMVVPVTFILTMLPSINGMGVREFGYVRLLSVVGIDKAAAISLSFMNILIPILISVWGAGLFIFQKRKIKQGDIDAIRSSL
ncbi:MAG: flippase-like domain-containing protein [Calditrichaceae bacterium]|nr:flippase-like domain-containing protein [Calditrichaceae bacterium]MBN2709193.1 flippase-like domain-containing protein [Calditrichaceae bacterium]RQV96149.1 MAG: UPF0104 family protein [Calditrichota bacterium]